MSYCIVFCAHTDKRLFNFPTATTRKLKIFCLAQVVVKSTVSRLGDTGVSGARCGGSVVVCAPARVVF